MSTGTKHIGAELGDIAEIVLIPGDPLRAKYVADNFFENVKQVTCVRNMLGFTGYFDGVRMSVMGTGMGAASSTIYITELITHYKVKKLIRIGSCGTMCYPKVKLGDLIIASGAGTDSNMNRCRFLGFDHAAVADFELLSDAVQVCQKEKFLYSSAHDSPQHSPVRDVSPGGGVASGPASASKGSTDDLFTRSKTTRYHVNKVFSSDFFYHPQEKELYPLLKKYNYVGIEMESATLYTTAAELGAQALSICTVTDEIRLTGGDVDDSSEKLKMEFVGMSSEQRETTLTEMMQVALHTASTSAKSKQD